MCVARKTTCAYEIRRVKFQTHMLLKNDLGSTFIELLSYYSEGFNQAMHIESYNYP